jgi:hypothetical protein
MAHDYFESIRIHKPTVTVVAEPMPTGRRAYRRARFGGPGKGAPAQDELVKFVKSFAKGNGTAPSLDEIQAHMGWTHRHSVNDALRKVAPRLGAAVIQEIRARSRRARA